MVPAHTTRITRGVRAVDSRMAGVTFIPTVSPKSA